MFHSRQVENKLHGQVIKTGFELVHTLTIILLQITMDPVPLLRLPMNKKQFKLLTGLWFKYNSLAKSLSFVPDIHMIQYWSDLRMENGKSKERKIALHSICRSKLDSLVAKQNEMRKSSSTTGFNSAMAKFKSLDDCGLEEVKSASKNRTGHYNTVNKVSVLADASGKAQHLSTSSLDGNLIIWNVNEVMANSDLSQLTLWSKNYK